MARGLPGIVLPQTPRWARSNFQSYCVRLPEACDQRTVMQRLLDDGIATRQGVMCAHREPAYANERWTCTPGSGICPCGAGGCRHLRASEAAQDHCILLPLFHEMTFEDQTRVADTLRAACAVGAA